MELETLGMCGIRYEGHVATTHEYRIDAGERQTQFTGGVRPSLSPLHPERAAAERALNPMAALPVVSTNSRRFNRQPPFSFQILPS